MGSVSSRWIFFPVSLERLWKKRGEVFLSSRQVIRILSVRLVNDGVLPAASFFSAISIRHSPSDRRLNNLACWLPLYTLTGVCETSLFESLSNNPAWFIRRCFGNHFLEIVYKTFLHFDVIFILYFLFLAMMLRRLIYRNISWNWKIYREISLQIFYCINRKLWL